MSIVDGVVVYVILWWTVLFAVLPWGVRTLDKPPLGHAVGAPEQPRLWRKALWTTVVAAVIWLAVYGLVESNLISFRRMVAGPDL